MNQNYEYSPESSFNVSYDGKSMMIVGCTDKESREIIIPPLIDDKPVTVIGNGAFSSRTNLRRIVLPKHVTHIENSAFKGCVNLVDAVLSEELRNIGSLSFCGCEALKRVTLPNCLERFEMNSFKDCKELREMVVYHREKKEHISFIVSPESDASIWMYLRGVLRAADPHRPYMSKYDSTFLEIRNEFDKYNIAVSRLTNPVDLSEENRIIYSDALAVAVPQIIRRDQVDRLTVIGNLGCLNNDSLDEYIHAASQIGGGCIAYLLEYKHRLGGHKGYDFSL